MRQRFLTFVIQSSGYAPDELRRRAETFIATLPDALAKVSDQEWATLIAGARSQLEEKLKTIREKADMFFVRAFAYDYDWDRQPPTLAALDQLTKEQVVAFLREALTAAPKRTVLLTSTNHKLTEEVKPTFTDRVAWKATRQYD